MRSIRNPTLLIAAADDLLVPWQLSELIAQEIAHARSLTHGYEPTREAAMAAFAKSWRR